jgi:hypothetical protein
MLIVLSGVFAGGTSLPDVIGGETLRTSPDSATSQYCTLTCTPENHSEIDLEFCACGTCTVTAKAGQLIGY